MPWHRMLGYITGTVDQELLLGNEYLAAANRILKAKVKRRCERRSTNASSTTNENEITEEGRT